MAARLKLLSVTTYVYLPKGSGGSALSTHDMCLSLLQRGVRPTVLARAEREVARALRRSGITGAVDTTLGYDVVRALDPVDHIDAVVERIAPTVAVVQSGRQIACVKRLVANGVSTVVYVRDVEFDRLEAPFFRHPLVRYIANSAFTAGAFRQAFGIECEVIPPVVRRAAYLTEPERTHIVFVNPKPQKGVDIVLALARRLPHRRFLIVECWPLGALERLKLRISRAGLRNVTWRAASIDMREVYRHARMVLVPSRWNEAWCRVVTEAHISEIPVIATDIGGLPESVGSGGILIPSDADIGQWANAVESLWTDAEMYELYVAAARASSERLEIDENHLTERLLATLSSVRGT